MPESILESVRTLFCLRTCLLKMYLKRSDIKKGVQYTLYILNGCKIYIVYKKRYFSVRISQSIQIKSDTFLYKVHNNI